MGKYFLSFVVLVVTFSYNMHNNKGFSEVVKHTIDGYYYKKYAENFFSDIGNYIPFINNDQTGKQDIHQTKDFSFSNINDLFSIDHCDKVIKKRSYISCYKYDLKISTALGYKLNGDDLRSGYIKKRFQFYPDKYLDQNKRAYPRDYTHSGYDKGHIRSHASTAFNKRMLYETYDMVNIWAQTPEVNRHQWIKVEKYERYIARKLGKVNVLNIAFFNSGSEYKRIGKHHVAVPDGFFKLIYTEDGNFEKCFFYENLIKDRKAKDRLKDHVISCSNIVYIP